MTHDPVKAKIIELVPEIVKQPFEGHEIYTIRPITLADVLRAIDKAYKPKYDIFSIICTPDGTIEEMDWGGGYEPAVGIRSCEWNLLEHYDNQTQEVKDFIGKLLGV